MSRAFQASLPLSRSAIDRDHASRAENGLLDALWASDEVRVVVLNRGLALAAAPVEGAARALRLLRPDELPEDVLPGAQTGEQTGERADERSGDAAPDAPATRFETVQLYLGRVLDSENDPGSQGAPLFALVVDDDTAAAIGEAAAIGGAASEAVAPRTAGAAGADRSAPDWLDLRRAAVQLDDLGAGAFTEALAVANWHSTHRFCPRCGSATSVEKGGWVRRCLREDIELFPRTDAAVIVGIVDAADRILLGSNALWVNNRYSLLAGFVEPGESLEAAAMREVAEESGVIIRDPEYVGSQPWPFPASLMVGFMAEASDTDRAELRPDGDEILELRWFSRAEVADPDSDVVLPGGASIARAIIERWYGGPLPEQHEW